MSRKTGYGRKSLVPTQDLDRPASRSSRSSPHLSPRSSPPPPPSFTIEDDDASYNSTPATSSARGGRRASLSSQSVGSSAGERQGHRRSQRRRQQLADPHSPPARAGPYGAEVAGENGADNDDETLDLSPRHVTSTGSCGAISPTGSNNNSSSSGLDTLRSALGGIGLARSDDENDAAAAEERRELSPRIHRGTSGDIDVGIAAVGAEGSLPHPEEIRSPSSARGGSAGVNAFWAFMCPFLSLVDIARREGPALFWRLLPSILVTKAFGLSLGTLFLCDLATIVAIVDEEKHLAYLDGGGENMTIPIDRDGTQEGERFVTEASTVGDEDGDGMIRLTFGLWSYSTKLEDHASSDDDVSFIVSEEERLTTCEYHMLDVEEGMIFWLDPMFNTARAFGIIAVAVGFVAVVILWMGVIRVRVVESGGRRKFKGRCLKHTVTIALILCSAFEGFTLLIFQAGMCGNTRMEKTYGQIYRDCEIAEGSSSPISAIVFWFLTGLAMLKLPHDDESEVVPSGSASEFGPDDGVAYGTGEDDDYDESLDVAEQHMGAKPSWWRRMLGSKSTPLPQVEPQRLDDYTTELRFDDDYEDDEWIDHKRVGSPGIQMRQIT